MTVRYSCCISRGTIIFWLSSFVKFVSVRCEHSYAQPISQRLLGTDVLLANDTDVLSTFSSLLDSGWAKDASLDIFFQGLSDSGLLEDMAQSSSQYTLFAPVNEAFDALDQVYFDQMISPSWSLHYRNLLSFHVVPSAIALSDILSSFPDANTTLITMNGEEIYISDASDLSESGILNFTLNSDYSLREASVLQDTGLQIANFLIYEIDSVMLPSFTAVDLLSLGQKYDGFQILVDLLGRMGISSDFLVGSYTILAPTDQAFLDLGEEKLIALRNDTTSALPRLLASHVIAGVYPLSSFQNGSLMTTLGGNAFRVNRSLNDLVQFNNATVIESDILANNGIAHAIDAVLMLDDLEDHSIQSIMTEDGDLELFTAALQAARLSLDSSDFDSATVFGPTNEAFKNSAIRESISKLTTSPWEAHLLDLMQLHIFQGVLYSKDLAEGVKIKMANGEMLSTEANNTGIFVSSSLNVVFLYQLDVIGVNGNIHKIDAVLMPSWTNKTLTDCMSKFEMFHDLVSRSNYSRSFNENDYTIFVPSNKALLTLGREKLARLIDPTYQAELDRFVSSHTLEGVYPLSHLESVNISLDIAKAELQQTLAKNGIIFGIDKVLEFSTNNPTSSSVQVSSSLALAYYLVSLMFFGRILMFGK